MIAYKVKTALNRLQQLYFNNIIAYPRVEKSYSLVSQELMSHKEFELKTAYFEPFYKEQIAFNKQTSLLFLNTFQFISPSVAYKISKDIDEYFTMDMKLKKESELRNLIEKKELFFDELNLSQSSKFYNPRLL